jgi:HemK-related putative methylase
MNPLKRQLIRASLPARRAVLRRRLNRTVLEEVDGLSLVVLPEVFNPVVFRTGAILAKRAARFVASELSTLAREPAVLDMGTGSGIGALAVAAAGCRVTAVDINPEAVRCARINALVNRLEERVTVVEGDLFASVSGRRFDLVLFNPPFFRGAPRDRKDGAWRAEDVIERFARGLPNALSVGGCALIVFSSDGDEAGLLDALKTEGFEMTIAEQRDFGNEVVTVYLCRSKELSR